MPMQVNLPGKPAGAAVPQVARLSQTGEYMKGANFPEAQGAFATTATDYKV